MTARYLLDTNIVSTLAEEPHGRVAQKALAIEEPRLVTSIVVACELRFGAVRVGSARLETALNAILGAMPVLPLEPGVEQHDAAIRSDLKRRGKPIGANNLLIAAHARSVGAILVTRNEREFRRVPGLDVESWHEKSAQRGEHGLGRFTRAIEMGVAARVTAVVREPLARILHEGLERGADSSGGLVFSTSSNRFSASSSSSASAS